MNEPQTTTTKDAAILLRGLIKRFDGLVAVNSVDLEIKKGRAFRSSWA